MDNLTFKAIWESTYFSTRHSKIPRHRHPELVSGSVRGEEQEKARSEMLKRVQHDITRSQSQQTKNKPFNKTSYEKQRTLETNHPNRNPYTFGYRHYTWPEFMPLSIERCAVSNEPLSNE